MTRSSLTACLVCTAVALALTAPAPDLLTAPNARAADITFAATNHHPKATVLVLRAGAWILGTVDNAVTDCRYFAARGYDAVAVDYPFTYFASLAAARSDAAAARAKRLPVYAFGYSAGGNLAAMLAVQGNVCTSSPSPSPSPTTLQILTTPLSSNNSLVKTAKNALHTALGGFGIPRTHAEISANEFPRKGDFHVGGIVGAVPATATSPLKSGKLLYSLLSASWIMERGTL